MEFEFFSAKNKLMESIFPEVIAYINSGSARKFEISTLSQVLLSNFVIHQGCYLLKYALPSDFYAQPEQDFVPDEYVPDRTGYECFENHIHTCDILSDNKKGVHHLAAGIIIADNLRYKLKSVFPDHRFRIIVSYPVLPILEDDTFIKNDCTVRFHSVRDGEIIYDDLDNFKFEAVGLIEV